MSDPLAIVRVGTLCPVGLDAEQSAASIWARMSGKYETWIRSRRHDPVVMGHLPLTVLPPLVEPLHAIVPPLTDLQHRLLRLVAPALQEALGIAHRRDAVAGTNEPRFASTALPPGLASLPPLLLAAPQPAPGEPEIIDERFVEHAVLQAGMPIDTARSRVFPTGHAGFFAALRYARTHLFEAGQAELAVIGGVDSYVDVERAAWLEREQRLSSSGPQDAFTPGEAAAFMLVAPRQVCRRHGLEPLAFIEAVGVADEPGHRYSDQPHRGDGLAQAVAQAFDERDPHVPPVRLVMAGLNGERLGAKEWGVAYLRNREHFAEPLRIEHSAEYTGDAGAALAPLMLGVAVAGLRERGIEGPALVWASSDRGQRGALLVQSS